MLESQIHSRYPHTPDDQLHTLATALYLSQQQRWPMLADGVAALHDAQVRRIDCGPFDASVQFNPKRIVSTGAKVDAASIRERKCFLCTGNLPAEQQGVLYKEKFLVLCNPMPIFREHFTISHVDHIPQSIEEQILTFLALAKELAPVYSVFYNGPKCGASAPDHMHFQAAPVGTIPVETQFASHARELRRVAGVTVSILERYGRSVIMLEGEKEQEMELTFLRLTSAMRRVMGTDEEPKMNVLGMAAEKRWRVFVFVRGKHRPDVFFKEGDEQIMISPATVDIGGLVVTPREKDFLRADGALITSIYEEVSVPQEMLRTIIDSL